MDPREGGSETLSSFQWQVESYSPEAQSYRLDIQPYAPADRRSTCELLLACDCRVRARNGRRKRPLRRAEAAHSLRAWPYALFHSS